jgi:aspergillopepsin I
VERANSKNRSIQYADGSGASGKVGTDTVTIGGTTVKGQAVELANKVSSTFVSDGSDGLVGLAFSSINTVSPQQQSTFFDNAQPSLNSPLFAAYLPYNADGAYDFGFTDSSKYTGSIVYTAVDSSNGFWEYPSTSYKVGSTTYTQSGFTGISDTGTTLVLMSDSAVTNYYKKVSGASYDSSQGGYTFPCSATLPTLSIAIPGSPRSLPLSSTSALLAVETLAAGLCRALASWSNWTIGTNILPSIRLR